AREVPVAAGKRRTAGRAEMSEKLQFVIGDYLQYRKRAGQKLFAREGARDKFTFCNFSDI
ncbi:hypothetical protein ACN4DT_00005, partial [Corynebacterium macclintockiae]|uniref:hypothetical protein n=1 Tax=Corynebacterium macclintockiae TaxID=2913501 RepID=UPI003EB8737B